MLYCLSTLKLVIYGQNFFFYKNNQQQLKVQKNQLLLYHQKTFTSWQLCTFLAALLVVGDDAVKH